MVNEFQRGCARSAFCSINHNKVRRNAGLNHGFGNRKPFPRVTNTEFEPGGLTAREFAQASDELQQFNRRIERAVGCRRDAIHADRHAPRLGNFRRHFGAGQNAAVARLGALAEFDFNHFDLRVAGVGRELFGVKSPVVIAATEVPRAHFPNQITAVFAVMYRDRTFARIVGKATAFGTCVERQNRIRTQSPKAHGGDVENAGAVGLRGVGADGDAKVVGCDLARSDRMRHPLMAVRMHIELGSKRPLVGIAFGALVHQRALGPRKRRGFVIAFNEILPNLRPDKFQHKPQVADHRVVAQDGALGLHQIQQTDAD